MKPMDRYERLLKHTFVDFQQTSEVIKAPLILERAEGLYYWDIEGKRYFDAIGGIYVAVLGHRHPRVMGAMRRQMEKMTFGAPLHGTSDVTLDLVEKLGTVTPGKLKFIKPFSGGSESIAAALKFARQYFEQTGHPGKYKFISLPSDIYYISTLPVLVEFGDVWIVSLAAVAISFLATLYPAWYASKLNPVEALRYE